jgi:hypothetical protein
MKQKTTAIIAAILLLGFLLAACQPAAPTEIPGLELTVQSAIDATRTAAPTATPQPTATNTPLPTFTPTPIRIQYGPTGYPENVNPLTGLEVSDPAILDRRPVMVKVANFPRSGRPHAGLSFADIVFDYYTGEGSNRFVALFYGQDAKQAGPVRSGRMIDRWLVGMYKAILGMEFADPVVYSKIINQLGGLVISGDHCPAICSDGPLTETSRFANTAELSKYYGTKTSSSNTKQNLDGMIFDTDIPAGGADGHEAVMRFGKNNEAQWIYDPATGKYLRWIDSVDVNNEFSGMIPLVDKLNGNQLSFTNVVFIFAEIETLNSGDTMHEFKIAGAKGRALIFRDGLVYDSTWKGVYDTPFTFFDKEGNPIPLKPGNTWIHIAGRSSLITEEPVGVWRVVNYTP